MLKSIEKEDCCGCNACGDICGHQAITFNIDKEGFWYPSVDETKCINCGLCERVCPVYTKIENKKGRFAQPISYAAYCKDDVVRLDSTSGGLFTEFASFVLNNGGYVGGAIFTDNHLVTQIVTNNTDLLVPLRGSKYIQSSSIGVYRTIRSLLASGHCIFYCACPCQIQALYNYLGKEWDNLTTCDFICRGVNSLKVFEKYLGMLEEQYKANVNNIKFRTKQYGWHNFATTISFDNGLEYVKDRAHDLFYCGYSSGLFSRPSCYNCHFKGIPRVADISLGDFWGIESIDSSMDQDRGTSLLMINSDKGAALLKHILNQIEFKEISFAECRNCNPAIDISIVSNGKSRESFFRDLELLSFSKLAKIYFDLPTLSNKIKKRINTIFKGLHIKL